MTSAQLAREVLARSAAIARLQLAIARGDLEAAPELWAPMAKLASSAALRAARLVEALKAETLASRP